MTQAELMKTLKLEVIKAGSQTAAAASMGISASYLSDVINGRREVGKSILGYLGIERIVTYRKRRAA